MSDNAAAAADGVYLGDFGSADNQSRRLQLNISNAAANGETSGIDSVRTTLAVMRADKLDCTRIGSFNIGKWTGSAGQQDSTQTYAAYETVASRRSASP